jgi:dihydrofolate reductase
VDTILMGRKTWAVAAAQAAPPTRRKARPNTRAAKEPAVRTYVFSRTLGPIEQPGVSVVSSDAAGFVRDLKARPGKGICLMGGGELAQALIAAGLVDVVGLNVHPILLGQGIPVFRDPGHRVQLALAECRPLHGGCVLATYNVVRAA